MPMGAVWAFAAGNAGAEVGKAERGGVGFWAQGADQGNTSASFSIRSSARTSMLAVSCFG
jgi:hypothetical protein